MIIQEAGLSDVGRALVEAAASEQGRPCEILRELFPYIDEASRRMSSRAISRWLKDNCGVQISPATVLRALRDPDKHYQDFVEYIEPWALIVENATDCAMESFLFDQRIFREVIQHPTVQAVDHDEVLAEFRELDAAISLLREKWFSLSHRSQANCRRFFRAAEDEKDTTSDEKEKTNEQTDQSN